MTTARTSSRSRSQNLALVASLVKRSRVLGMGLGSLVHFLHIDISSLLVYIFVCFTPIVGFWLAIFLFHVYHNMEPHGPDG